MSYIKRILVVVGFAVLSISAYAAVTPLNKSEYGTNRSAAPLSAPSRAGDCTLGSCPTYYHGTESGCSLKNPAGGRQCKTTNCCYDDAETTLQECPDEYNYAVADSEMSAIVNLSSREYCTGYKNGIKSNYFYENPQLCSMKGITDSAYLDSLVESSSCGSYKNMTETTCYKSNGGGFETVKACVLSSTVGYPHCKSGDLSLSSYPMTTCGAGGDEASMPCYTECGNSKYCLRFTCSKDTLDSCSSLETAKINDGWFSSGVASSKTDDIYHQCLVGTDVKYMGFFCQNYWEEDECESSDNNGTIGSNCVVKLADGTSKDVYQCSCGAYKTLDEFCSSEHSDDADCKNKYYGVGKKCTLDKDSSGNSLVKYERFDNAIGLCSDIRGVKYVDKPESGECPSYPEEAEPVEETCRPTAGSATTKTVCKYCAGYRYENLNEAESACGNGTPVSCHVGNSSIVYMGCSCDSAKYKTKEQWCEVPPYNSEEDCLFGTVEAGQQCRSGTGDDQDVVLYEKLICSANFKTKQEWCAANAGSVIDGYDCEKDYVGFGRPCKLDGSDETSWKYVNYVLGCPEGANSNIKDTKEECSVSTEDNIQPYYDTCQVTGSDGKQQSRYICKCPPGYGTECAEAYKQRGGHSCTFDFSSAGVQLTKYERCGIKCDHVYAAAYSKEVYDCSEVDTYVSGVRGGVENPQKCMMGDKTEQYICACPNNFKTIGEWCEENYASEGIESAVECTRTYSGRGSECRRDIETDTMGNPIKVLSKYAYYIRRCPSDRPLYYSEEDCRFIGGEYDYSCYDDSGNERVVCQCPTDWYQADGTSENNSKCEYAGFNNSLGSSDTEESDAPQSSYSAEASGETCDFDGINETKYSECVVKCNDVLSDANVAIPNAYTYLSSDSGTPTNILCATRMGNGAVFGFASIGADKSYCSLNHSIMYPCYCPAGFKDCSAEENMVAADGAKICSVNGKTYYSECQHLACPEESPTLAVVDAGTDITANFGAGAISSPCVVKDSSGTLVNKLQVSCNTSEYSDPCDYPYEAPKTGTWCKYGDGSTLMKDGRPHYKAGACRVQKTLGECGKNIAGHEDETYTIFVAATESECKTKYGPGIATQLCEYGAEQGYKRAYNCYYDPTDFKWTTANCGVRHDLTGNYIIINGKKHWNQCNCASAYKHHKFNCGGLLSGNPCQQELNRTLINGDASLKEAVEENFISEDATLPFYPYCQCSADYKEICDEDGSGRYKGVGQACNGKYISCECVPDKLPDNWTDNYYGCPGGKKPTGVWKDNGCGKKYYQCSVVECTWEYTEMCGAPLIPVGQSCQDNEGNIGGYKACTCPTEYKICPAGQVGVGEPCNLKGVAYYKECKSQDACTSLAIETCTGPLQLGVNPCSRDGITYYESCVCANGYTEVCGEEEVGVGNYCELGGKKYYKECKKPEKGKCSEEDGYVTACDTNQESYSPCAVTGADGRQVVKYLCRCPNNWYTSSTCKEGTLGGEKCVQNGTEYYSQCIAGNACTPYQKLTYSVCTEAQTGDGGSCVVEGNPDDPEDGKTKYAVCRDSNNCYETGFKYSCSGYDQSALGESCIDANGNKLYKSCPCPSSYVTCSNPNASKGNKCVPLEENGNFGTPRYSNCECDRSKYKYTCLADESGVGNIGIIPPQGNNYCEVEGDPIVETTTDENGNTTTITQSNKIRYYTSCDCKSGYQYTCSDGEHGEMVPDGYESDYCQINSTKFYKGCDCSGEYSVTADDCKANPGEMPDTSKGSCTVKGTVAMSSGSGSSETRAGSNNRGNTTYYKGCICKPNYNLTCDNTLHDVSDIQGCDLDKDGVDVKYPKCICNAATSKSCKANGRNKGILPDETSICTEQVADANGNASSSSKYTQCKCSEEYNIPESSCEAEEYDQSGEDYCDLAENASGDGASTPLDAGKYYKRCLCDPKVYDNSKEIPEEKTISEFCGGDNNVFLKNASDPQYCQELFLDEDGNEKYTWRPNKSLCCTNAENLDGYTQFSSQTYSSLTDFFDEYGDATIENQIESACGHKYNASFILNCSGNLLFKCINQSVADNAKKGIVWYTQQECTDLNKGREVKSSAKTSDNKSVSSVNISGSWKEDATIYPDCDCNSKYKYSSDDDCATYYRSIGGKNNTKLFCTDSPQSRTPSSPKNECPKQIFKLYPGDFCIDKNNVKKHERCVCKQGKTKDQTETSSCISDYCGDPSRGTDDEACWISGIPEIYGGKAIRVSVYNGGDSSNDKTCNCPGARNSSDLNGCSGGNTDESVASCKYPEVTYPVAPYS